MLDNVVKYECVSGFFYGERDIYQIGERSHYVGDIVSIHELDEEDKLLAQNYGIFNKEDKDEQIRKYNTVA